MKVACEGIHDPERDQMTEPRCAVLQKVRQALLRRYGYGVKEHKVFKALLSTMKGKDVSQILANGFLYHLGRIYRSCFPFGKTVIVGVKQGLLRGRQVSSALGTTYYSFQGIPYAKPPIGPLRFRDPKPPLPWRGVRSALREGSMCVQEDFITGMTRGSEDCLFLNIFTPELPSSECSSAEKKAVMVWIHGGIFLMGSGNAEVYGPDFFMEEDVILVTLNYRLGVLGFLCTHSSDAPGNAGLKDIVQALKWVQENIESFGGDPKKVTIFGESAGGAAVQFLMLSPLTKGLFSNAISQSGSALCPWALTVDDPLKTAFRLAKAFGYSDTSPDPKALVDFLRTLPADVLAKKQSTAISERNRLECIPFPFLPCVETHSANALITEHPYDILKGNKMPNDVPYITGINEMEGAILLKPIIDKLPPIEQLNSDFERLVPRFLNLHYGSDKSAHVARKMKKFYFGDKQCDSSAYKEFVNLATDTFFYHATYTTLKFHSKHCKSPVYNYYFLFDGDFALMKKLLNVPTIEGPVHADELGYLFYIPVIGPRVKHKTPETQCMKKMVRLWTNFAKTGNPTPNASDPWLKELVWQPYTETHPNCLVMGKSFKMENAVHMDRLQFWNDMQGLVK